MTTHSDIEITGGCLCRAVRYSVTAAPIVARICWCRLCQYLGAGSSTVNVCFPSNAMTVTGALADYLSVADSGNRIHRKFCPACGTPLFSAAEARPHLIFARAGTLDDTEIARPVMTIWTSQAPSWACISTELPRVEGQPPPAG
ncbi:MAG: GFA family protein [Pseudomonadota bacterium]